MKDTQEYEDICMLIVEETPLEIPPKAAAQRQQRGKPASTTPSAQTKRALATIRGNDDEDGARQPKKQRSTDKAAVGGGGSGSARKLKAAADALVKPTFFSVLADALDGGDIDVCMVRATAFAIRNPAACKTMLEAAEGARAIDEGSVDVCWLDN
jgi:hypothetical protein